MPFTPFGPAKVSKAALNEFVAYANTIDEKYGVLRRRDIPGVRAFPTLMTTPPTVAVATATQITGSVLTQPDLGNFTYLGGTIRRGGTGYPDADGVWSSGMYGTTTPSPYFVDFMLDTVDATGRFEVFHKRNNAGCRILVMVNGHWQYVSQAPTIKGTGNDLAFALVTLGAAGLYRIRLECDPNFLFGGIQAGPTDGITPADGPRRRVVVIGDSFTEPTVSDTSGTQHTGDGYVQLLSYALNVDAWSAGAGATGYLQARTSPATARLAPRLPEITPHVNGAEVWVAYGINDYANFTAAAIGAEALSDFQALLAAGATRLVIVGPYWPRAVTSAAVNLLATRDAINASAATVGAVFLDPLSLPVQTPPTVATTLSTATAVNANTITLPVALGTRDYWVQIGTGANAEVRLVGGQGGTGPYTYGFGAASRGGGLTQAHAAGEAVIPVGPGWVTGNGRQGTTNSTGTADRYTGTDATHPTVAGHRAIARVLTALYLRALSN